MSDLDELIQRLEKATAPSRELDLAIAFHAGRIHASVGQFSSCCWSAGGDEVILTYPDGKQGAYDGKEVARYTASLDAALTLVPEECWAEGTLSSPATIEVHNQTIYQALGEGRAATPALALCIAALKARKAMERAT